MWCKHFSPLPPFPSDILYTGRPQKITVLYVPAGGGRPFSASERLLKGLGVGVGCCLVFFSFFGIGYSVFTGVSFVLVVGSRFGRSVAVVSFVVFISFACLVCVGRSGDFVLNLCWSFRLS